MFFFTTCSCECCLPRDLLDGHLHGLSQLLQLPAARASAQRGGGEALQGCLQLLLHTKSTRQPRTQLTGRLVLIRGQLLSTDLAEAGGGHTEAHAGAKVRQAQPQEPAQHGRAALQDAEHIR